MKTFYIILSIMFFAFTYLVSRENANSIGKSLLVAFGLMIFWPVVIFAATIYLAVGRIRHYTKKEEDNPENVSPTSHSLSAKDYERLKVAMTAEESKTEEIVTEQVNQDWEEIKEQ